MEHKINFTTINSDGNEVKWSWTPDELEEKYWGDEDIPMLDDGMVDCEFAGQPLYFETFEDLVMTFLGAID